jgi:hypothetical protein
METNLLLISSLFFVTNAVTTCYKQYYLYAFLFAGLTTTSLLVHTTLIKDKHTAKIMDKIFILSIVLYGGHLLYQKSTDNLIPVLSVVLLFLLASFLYIYGYAVNQYCFHPDLCTGNRYHCLLHLASSIGHHLITFL